MLKSLFRQYDVRPIRVGALLGALGGLGKFAATGLFVVILYLIDRVLIATGVSDGTSGLSLITGFLIGPIIVVLGMPWTYLSIGANSPTVFIIGAAVGLTINGALIGFFFGLFARFRQGRINAD